MARSKVHACVVLMSFWLVEQMAVDQMMIGMASV